MGNQLVTRAHGPLLGSLTSRLLRSANAVPCITGTLTAELCHHVPFTDVGPPEAIFVCLILCTRSVTDLAVMGLSLCFTTKLRIHYLSSWKCPSLHRTPVYTWHSCPSLIALHLVRSFTELRVINSRHSLLSCLATRTPVRSPIPAVHDSIPPLCLSLQQLKQSQ